MNNENDLKFNVIYECANRILKFKDDFKKADLEEEKEHLAFLMSEQEVLIQEYTDAPMEYILRYVTKINDAKQTLENEQDPERRRMLENAINTYTGFINSDIYSKTLKQESNAKNDSKSTDRCSQYRASQKYDLELLKLAKEVSQMCEDHHNKLKKSRKRNQC